MGQVTHHLIAAISTTAGHAGGRCKALGGAIFTENVFGLPGLGKVAIDSIYAYDLPLVQGVVVFATLSIIVFNLAVDLVYAVVDPRIRLN